MRQIPLPDLVILITATESNVIDVPALAQLHIGAPAVQAETVTVHVSLDGGTSYQILTRPNDAANVVTVATKVTVITALAAMKLKLVAGVGVAAAHTYKVLGLED